jgi:hypothetical protein
MFNFRPMNAIRRSLALDEEPATESLRGGIDLGKHLADAKHGFYQ